MLRSSRVVLLIFALGACTEHLTPPDVVDASMDTADATDAIDAVCTNAQTTFDCPLSVAQSICAMHQPCQVCPQNLLPDGGSTVWMAVQQESSCACPPPMNPPHG